MCKLRISMNIPAPAAADAGKAAVLFAGRWLPQAGSKATGRDGPNKKFDVLDIFCISMHAWTFWQLSKVFNQFLLFFSILKWFAAFWDVLTTII